jgi:hypothetical protein
MGKSQLYISTLLNIVPPPQKSEQFRQKFRDFRTTLIEVMYRQRPVVIYVRGMKSVPAYYT